jgi:hypothetical protein
VNAENNAKGLKEANEKTKAGNEVNPSVDSSSNAPAPSSDPIQQDEYAPKNDSSTAESQTVKPMPPASSSVKDQAASTPSSPDLRVYIDFTPESERRDRVEARYTHLKCLHDFITSELGDLLELRRNIADGKQEYIEFEDLWHLYKPGDVIYSNDNGHHQLYKVYFVTGGQSLKRTRTTQEATTINNMRQRLWEWVPPELREDGEDETLEKLFREESSGIGTWTAFKVDGYSMAFDGEYCGPIDVSKKIQPYGMRREITSLPMLTKFFVTWKNADESFYSRVGTRVMMAVLSH